MPKLEARIRTNRPNFQRYECMLSPARGISCYNTGSRVIVGGTGNVHLTPSQARRFARKMIDMADNIEEKNKCQQN